MADQRLPKEYYLTEDVVSLSRDLLGKSLFTCVGGELTGGVILETEAYRAPEDRASHAYGNRFTARNAVMFDEGGIAYVYLCYGLHNLFNVVTGPAGTPHAILIRALQPTHGIETMLLRRKKKTLDKTLANGPGSLAQALGIDRSFNGNSLMESNVWLTDNGLTISEADVIASPRVGVEYAGEDAKLPWNFRLILGIDYRIR